MKSKVEAPIVTPVFEKGNSPRPAGASDRSETVGITCPDCGGSLRLRSGEKSIRCQYCGSALYVISPKGVKQFILPPVISDGKARLAALHFLSEKTGGKIKARHASILDIRLINVPFWRLKGRLAGWVCGEKITRRQIEVSAPGPNGTQTRFKTIEERSPFSKLIYKNVDWSTPACSLRDLGLQGIALKARLLDWNIFDHELKKTLNIALPMKTRKEAERDAFQHLSTLAKPASSNIRSSRFDIFSKDFSIYYYPVYILRYRHAGRIYSITVDGNEGHIIRGDYPRQKKGSRALIFFIPATLAFLFGTWAPLVPIAALAVYICNMAAEGRFIAPHHWLMGNLQKWLGGGSTDG
ncbi:MAG: hypothetical protein JW814_01155 [Candidatus Krumholzibacteriota bacterium]|nr:hypothetical protein [Candidatus Krumholzibacteriota bacterium]